ncbi:uncharacterized protein [Dasypus novemcinctus]|uniref:uncharacterized protein n=1 Tax=Dasypus novemcinctus TaxID=9361 RepID=UPI0039C98001
MAFFKNFQQNLPSVSSLVDTISSAVEDLTTAVGEVSHALSDSVTAQVTSVINGFHPEDENSVVEDARETSKQENITLPEVSKDSNCQKAQSNLEHRTKQINCHNTSVSQKQDQNRHEKGIFKHINDRQQTLSKYHETGNADDSFKGRASDGGPSVLNQNMWAGSACQELESTDRCKIIGSGISANGKNVLQEVKYLEMKGNQEKTSGIKILHRQKKYVATDYRKLEEDTKSQHVFLGREQEKMGHFNKNKHLIDFGHSDHLKKDEHHIKSKGLKGKACSGNKFSSKDISTNGRHMIQKPITKEEVHPASSTNSKDRLHEKNKEQINQTKYYKIKGDIKTMKNEAIFAKKGKAKNKDENYSKIIPEKGEVS